MSEVGELVRTLYDEVFKRDLLGKLGPGSLAGLAIMRRLGVDPLSISGGLNEWLLFIAAVPLLYVAGVALQIGGELVGLHSASPRPKYIVCLRTRGTWKQANLDFDRRLALIRAAPDDQWSSGAKAQRERFVVLKEACGNMGLALLIAVACMAGTQGMDQTGAVAILATLALASHALHARRQATFEINVLENNGLLTTSEASEMRRRV